MASERLDRNDTVLIVIDVQDRLAPHIHEHMRIEQNVSRLIRGAHILSVPLIVTEQYPEGIGRTTSTVRKALDETVGYHPIEKLCFSAQGCEPFSGKLRDLKRSHVLLAGIETHVCIWQTALDLLNDGYEVTVIADAVSSRDPRNRDVALRRLEREGALLSTTEMALFELTVVCGTDEFQAIHRLIR